MIIQDIIMADSNQGGRKLTIQFLIKTFYPSGRRGTSFFILNCGEYGFGQRRAP